jgi:hypothetical protein
MFFLIGGSQTIEVEDIQVTVTDLDQLSVTVEDLTIVNVTVED